MSESILVLDNLSKEFPSVSGGQSLRILDGLGLDLRAGETVAVLGTSGSGKSTLLSLVAGLDAPSGGAVFLGEKNLVTMSESELVSYRALHLGIVFQQFHLMPHLSALENVSLPLELADNEDAVTKARVALQSVGLAERLDHYPAQLSGGECQRVAIARALCVEPLLLLADEPTGSLDRQTADAVADLLFNLVQNGKTTMLLVTHNLQLAQRCERVLHLRDGRLVEDV
tara:strand:- start:766 stop:1449 length:684 start_codon:yes stop_codon:yes gene_type:complete